MGKFAYDESKDKLLDHFNWSKDRVIQETEKLKKQFENFCVK